MKNSTTEMKTFKEITAIFSPTTFEELTYRNAGVESLRFAIPEYVEKYLAAIEIGLTSVQGTLTSQEAKAILDVMNGYMCYACHLPCVVQAGIALEVAETDGIGEKWGIDTQVLVKKLQNIGPLETIGLLEWADRFWHNCSSIEVEDAVQGFHG
jgi:hypothetical protein